jgi:hypothetical protein
MLFTTIPTEQTTAVTDLVLAGVALACLIALRRVRHVARWKVDVWSWVVGLVAIAALLGTVAHGFQLDERLQDLIWQPIFLALGLAVGLFVVAAVVDWRGGSAARSVLPLMLIVGVAFFALTRFVRGTFLVFVLYEAVAMLFALGVYGALTARRQLSGAAWVSAGIVLNMIGAAIQATESVTISVGVPFDHNGVFHLVQMVAVVVLTVGIRRGIGDEKRETGDGKRET